MAKIPQAFVYEKLSCHAHRSLLSDDAPLNIHVISVTLEVLKFDTSPLNEVARANIDLISITLEVSKLDKFWLKELAL